MARSRASRVRAWAARSAVCPWAAHGSVGDRSGEEGGTDRRCVPRLAQACCPPTAVCPRRWSSTTVAPGRSGGPSPSFTSGRNPAVAVAPSTVMPACRPWTPRAPSRVTCWPSVWGPLPMPRCPAGARPSPRGIARCTPEASTHGRRRRSRAVRRGRSIARACWARAVSRAAAWSAFVGAVAPGAARHGPSSAHCPGRLCPRRRLGTAPPRSPPECHPTTAARPPGQRPPGGAADHPRGAAGRCRQSDGVGARRSRRRRDARRTRRPEGVASRGAARRPAGSAAVNRSTRPPDASGEEPCL
jgi:hypothetical protein